MIKKLCTLSLFILFASAFPQGKANWIWAKKGNGGGEGFGSATDNSANVCYTGYFEAGPISFGTYTLSYLGGAEIFLVKYDSSGQVLWAKKPIGTGASSDQGMAVATDQNSNIYLTGSFRSSTLNFGAYTINNPNSSQINWNVFLAKYGPGGNVLWAKGIPAFAGDSSMQDVAYGVAYDPTGYVYIAGSFSTDSLIFGSTILTNLYPGINDNIFIAKYDTSGNPIWARTARGSGSDIANSVAIDKFGNVYITGNFGSDTLFISNDTLINANSNGSSPDMFVIKYDAAGNEMWARRAGGLNNDRSFSIATDKSGYIYTAGGFISDTLKFGPYTLTSVYAMGGGGNFFLTKWDQTGNVMFAKSGTNINNNAYAGYSCATDNLNNVLVSGYFLGSKAIFDSDTMHFNGGWDPSFVAKYDSSGNFVCGSLLQSGGDDILSICTDPANNAYIVGDLLAGPVVIGTTTLSVLNGEIPFIAKFRSNCTKIDGIEWLKDGFKFSVYPNPANNTLILDLPKFIEVKEIQIQNTLGQIIKNSAFAEKVNIEDLSAGFYLLKIFLEHNQILTTRFIKE